LPFFAMRGTCFNARRAVAVTTSVLGGQLLRRGSGHVKSARIISFDPFRARRIAMSRILVADAVLGATGGLFEHSHAMKVWFPELLSMAEAPSSQ
jgi:hypothetical protein